jgi:CBS domain-containing protein
MTEELKTCRPETNLAAAAMEMWSGDCGFLPVVEDGRLRGVITDRDICMAVATKHRDAAEIKVAEVMQGPAFTCAPGDSVEEAMATMRDRQVRRLPVVDDGRLRGILSLNDLALAADGDVAAKRVPGREVLRTLQGICAHQAPTPAPALAYA